MRKNLLAAALGGALVVALFATSGTAATADDRIDLMSSDIQAPVAAPSDKLNDVYYVQKHNTYDAGGKLTDSLNQGVMAIELDIIDRGSWQGDVNGPLVSHSWDVGKKNCSGLHNDTRLSECLGDIVAWMDAHLDAPPIQLLIDMKG